MHESAAPATPQFSLPCPHCRQQTVSLKSYYTPLIVYLILAVWWRKKTTIACPNCMKGELLAWSGTSLLTTHVFWPFIILPITVVRWIDMRQPGHSRELLQRAASGEFGPEIASIASRQLGSPWAATNPALARLLGLATCAVGLVVVIGCLIGMTLSWYSGSLSKNDVTSAYVFTSLLSAVGAGLLWSGIGRIRARPGTWTTFGIAVAAGGVAFVIASPLIRDAYWGYRERQAASQLANTTWKYERLPWQVVTPQNVQKMLELMIARDNVPSIAFFMEQIEFHRGDEPAFQQVLAEFHRVYQDDMGASMESMEDDSAWRGSAAPSPMSEPLRSGDGSRDTPEDFSPGAEF